MTLHTGTTMELEFDEITYLKNPEQMVLKADYQQFLMSLTGPTVIDITGDNQEKCRVFIVLLRGNEPSGLIAIHRWLTMNDELPKPSTNVRIIICSVEAANMPPLFTRSHIDGGKDLSICFDNLSPNCCGYAHRAVLIKKAIEEVSPELIIDIHNTFGSSPAFAIAPVITPEILSISSYFCQTILLSTFKMGTLLDVTFNCTTLCIACGARDDEQSHEIALQGIIHSTANKNASHFSQLKTVDVLYKPVCLTLKPHVSLTFANHDEGFSGVTIKDNLEQLNFGMSREGQMLGWVDAKGLDNLSLINEYGDDVINDYLTLRDNIIVCKTDLRVFMATKQKNPIQDNCLFYLVKSPKRE